MANQISADFGYVLTDISLSFDAGVSETAEVTGSQLPQLSALMLSGYPVRLLYQAI
ncbi:MAG: hypothetical protein F6J97_08110 [Leptolyngbya sp. SIO4C1]|nr:hypothetical protein [Leptolyngbya sp. SIO4C1]